MDYIMIYNHDRVKGKEYNYRWLINLESFSLSDCMIYLFM